MPIISAANNLTIRYDDHFWRLFAGPSDGVLPVAEAGYEGLAYGAAFGAARHLPTEGLLLVDDIVMVVAGWATEDEHWHLGLLLSDNAAQARGGRWCGLARWDFQEGDQAERSGQALADILQRPFRVVPPLQAPTEGLAEPGKRAATPAVEIELTPLPMTIGEWRFRDDEMLGLVAERSGTWRRDMLLRTLMFFILTIGFGALSGGALMTRYAPVQPEWLPWAGLGITVVMLLITISRLRALMRAVYTIIDTHLCMVKQMSGRRRAIVQVPFEGIDSVLVSHKISRREKTPIYNHEGVRYDRIWAETWLHLNSPRRGFIQVAYLGHVEGQIQSDLEFNQHSFNLDEINTPAHHVAMHLAHAIGVPALAEER